MTTAEVLEGLDRQLTRVASWVSRAYRMNREEVQAEARYLAVVAAGKYTPDRGDRDRWVTHYVLGKLRKAGRKELRRRAMVRVRRLGGGEGEYLDGRFDAGEFARDNRLGEDATRVLLAVLSGAVDLEIFDTRRPGEALRQRVRIHYLARDWSERRVRRALVELRRVAP